MKKVVVNIILMVIISGVALATYVLSLDQEEFKQLVDSVFTPATQVYTLSGVALHETKADCFMIVGERVLDVSAFVEWHPGGDVIIEGCGKDATAMFSSVRGHSEGMVYILLNLFTIGVIAPE